MPLDWDNPGDTWDSGLTWDAGDGPDPGNIQQFLDLITSEFNQQPDYMDWLAVLLQPLADILFASGEFTTLFNIDEAEGVQLDIIGLWVGCTRNLSVPIENVFFTFDDGPGFDRGALWGPSLPINQLITLPDAQYRTLLFATVASNHWDGTILGAYEAYAIMFGPGGYTMVIIDLQNMSMDLVLGGPIPDAITLALFLGGYLSLKPVGVRVNNYIVSANPTAPIFAFDAPADSPVLAGFDVGAFANFYEGS